MELLPIGSRYGGMIPNHLVLICALLWLKLSASALSLRRYLDPYPCISVDEVLTPLAAVSFHRVGRISVGLWCPCRSCPGLPHVPRNASHREQRSCQARHVLPGEHRFALAPVIYAATELSSIAVFVAFVSSFGFLLKSLKMFTAHAKAFRESAYIYRGQAPTLLPGPIVVYLEHARRPLIGAMFHRFCMVRCTR